MCLTRPNFFCHREKIFFCIPAQQVIFLCTFKHNGKANFKKFLNTGQGVGQRVGTYRDNHIYLKIHAGKLNFPYTCLRSQFFKNFQILNFVKIFSSFIYLKNIIKNFFGVKFSDAKKGNVF